MIGRSAPQLTLRVLELVARDKACEYPTNACNGDACPLAKGFYDRLPAARSEALISPWLDQAGLRDVALRHQVCPYYLSQELARWADVVIADYNYYFDLSALLFGLCQFNQWRVAVLVDEAHNMVERARQMYSASLDQHAMNQVRLLAPEPLKNPCNGSIVNGMRCTRNRWRLIRLTPVRRRSFSPVSRCALRRSAIISTTTRRQRTASCSVSISTPFSSGALPSCSTSIICSTSANVSQAKSAVTIDPA